MPLEDIDISMSLSVIPDDVVEFLREAELRVNHFVRNQSKHATGFVPSDFGTIYRALRAISESNLTPGNSLCEWGSGFGVVASLAAMLEFKACGIEIESELVDASRTLADDFGLPVEFVHGSFIPLGSEASAKEAYADNNGEYPWLVTDADDAYSELGVGPNDFDIVFAYPWPGEEYFFTSLFERHAADKALLLTYDYLNSVRLLAKTS